MNKKIKIIDKSKNRISFQRILKDDYYIIIIEKSNGEKIAFDSEFMGK